MIRMKRQCNDLHDYTRKISSIQTHRSDPATHAQRLAHRPAGDAASSQPFTPIRTVAPRADVVLRMRIITASHARTLIPQRRSEQRETEETQRDGTHARMHACKMLLSQKACLKFHPQPLSGGFKRRCGGHPSDAQPSNQMRSEGSRTDRALIRREH